MDTTGNIYERFEQFASTQPNAPALIVPGRCVLTYAGLAVQIRAVREQLRHLDCVPGDIVAGVIVDRPMMALACTSICASATFAPLNPHLMYEAYLGLLRRLRPRAVLLCCNATHPARKAVAALDLVSVELRPDEGDLADAFKSAKTPTRASPVRPDPHDPRWAYVLSGSGSTGASKLIPVTHEAMHRNAAVLGGRFEFSPADVGCHIIPMHLPQGFRVALMIPLLCGSSVVVLAENDAYGFFNALVEHGITWVSAGFTLVRHLAERSAEFAQRIARSRLRFVRCGSGTLPADTIRFVEERLHAPMIAAYSTLETGAISIDPLPPKARKPGGVGVPVHDDVRVVDNTGMPCAAGQLGEIVVGGPMVFGGYFNDPIRTQQSFRAGWYRTGDIGMFDRDGYLFVRGRVNEVANRGGEKIALPELDAVMERSPGVKEAAAFALPHPTLGEELFAAVVRDGAAECSTATLKAGLSAALGRRALPRRVFFVDRLPRTGTGKIQRHELARQFGHNEWNEETRQSAPCTPIAAALQAMWTVLLSAGQVRMNDDFFMLGGDSLSGARLLAQVKEVFAVELGLDALFHECATVTGMARAIEAARSVDAGVDRA